jgi:hypothetical protein
VALTRLRVTYLRTTRRQKEALRLMASQRGESEAYVLRCLIDREAKAVLEGQSGAGLPPSRKETDFATAFVKALIRNAKSELKQRRGRQ